MFTSTKIYFVQSHLKRHLKCQWKIVPYCLLGCYICHQFQSRFSVSLSCPFIALTWNEKLKWPLERSINFFPFFCSTVAFFNASRFFPFFSLNKTTFVRYACKINKLTKWVHSVRLICIALRYAEFDDSFELSALLLVSLMVSISGSSWDLKNRSKNVISTAPIYNRSRKMSSVPRDKVIKRIQNSLIDCSWAEPFREYFKSKFFLGNDVRGNISFTTNREVH